MLFAVGDFHQLDPPDNGVPLCRVPDDMTRAGEFAPSACTEYGLSLVWDTCKNMGLHGVTELFQPMRCKDLWWNEVLEECRFGCLSRNNYLFLHGQSTTVTGSSVGGKPMCGNAKCAGLHAKEVMEKAGILV